MNISIIYQVYSLVSSSEFLKLFRSTNLGKYDKNFVDQWQKYPADNEKYADEVGIAVKIKTYFWVNEIMVLVN